VQGVTSAQTDRVLICEPGGDAEMNVRNRQNGEALPAQPGEPGQSAGPAVRFDLSSPQLDRQGRREFRCNPLADRELGRLLIVKPSQDTCGFYLPRQRRNEQRSVEVEHQ